MPYFAQLDSDNRVTEVRVFDSAPSVGRWIETSFETRYGQHMTGGVPLRKNFAAVGWTYDAELDAFIPKKTFSSWVLNPETCNWSPPISYPSDGGKYVWDESVLNWKLFSSISI